MTDSSRGYQQFLAELKRRRVFRVMAVYGIVGFVVLQVVDLAVPALLLPEWTYRLVALILLIGFPVAIVLAWAFEMTPEGVQKTRPAAPGEIDQLISAPASQRWPAGLLALVGVVALVAGTWWIARRTAPDAAGAQDQADISLALADPATDPRPSLAVLPFVNMSADEMQEYFSDGMTEEILNTLAKIDDLRVSGRTSAFAYKNRNLDLRNIGDELGVRYLIEGSVRKAGNELRITAQLIDATDGSHLWSEAYDRDMEDVFAIQTEIAQAIAAELRVPLGLADPTDLVQPLGDLEAYDLYLAGRARIRERGAGLDEAVQLFQAAIARDSTWAPAWAGLAEATELRLWWPQAWEEPSQRFEVWEGELDKAEKAARRALELDPGNATAYVALGSVMRGRRQVEESEGAYREALAIDPDNAEPHQQYGELLHSLGRLEESVVALDRSVVLDPIPIRWLHLGLALQLDDRPEEAEEAYRNGIRSDSNGDLQQLRWLLEDLLIQAGRYDEAAEAISSDTSHWDPTSSLQRLSLIREGDVSAIPDSVRSTLDPHLWLHLNEPDSAVVEMAKSLRRCFEEFNHYFCSRLWVPALDEVRSRPMVQAAMAEWGISESDLQRTPPERRRRPRSLVREGRAASP